VAEGARVTPTAPPPMPKKTGDGGGLTWLSAWGNKVPPRGPSVCSADSGGDRCVGHLSPARIEFDIILRSRSSKSSPC
jgi:hypothetical protein